MPVLSRNGQVCEYVAGEPDSISQRATGLLFDVVECYVAMQAASCKPRNLQDASLSVAQQPFVRKDGPKRLGSWLLGFWRSVRQTDRIFAIDSTASGSGNHGSQTKVRRRGLRLLGSREARKEAVRDAGSTVVAVAGKCARKKEKEGLCKEKSRSE